jgi:hypothetical protein
MFCQAAWENEMTDLIIPSRRRFLTMASALVAAPAIVRADSLMRVKSWIEPTEAEKLRRRVEALRRMKPSEFLREIVGVELDPWQALACDQRGW